MLVQPITNLNNYYAKPCNTIKKNNSATMHYDLGTTSLPAFTDAKSLTNISFKAAIHIYTIIGSLKGVKHELRKGVDVNIQDKYGYAPLHWACQYGKLNIVKYLCEQKGINLNIQTDNGWTPSHLACNNNKSDIVKYLGEQEGIDLNIQEEDGWTPSHLACAEGYADIVKHYCERNDIDFTIRNDSGKKPLDLARNEGYQYRDWFKKLEEKTKYQLDHPETIEQIKAMKNMMQNLEYLKITTNSTP